MKAFRSDWILEPPLQITLGIDLLPAGDSVKKMDAGRTEDAPGRRCRKYLVGQILTARQLASLYFWALEGHRSGWDTALPPGALCLSPQYIDKATVQGRLF